MANNYQRKISSEEASEGYILVLKDRLSFFPPIGQTFDLQDGGRSSTAKVEARDCTCQGPEKPHEHYFIRRAGLARGATVLISAEGGTYRIATS